MNINNLKEIVNKKLVGTDIPDYLVMDALDYFKRNNLSEEKVNKILDYYLAIYDEYGKIFNKEVDNSIFTNSYLLIGPMCAGKSTTADVLSHLTNLDRVSLDNRKQLGEYYDKVKNISDFKLRELFLTLLTLSNLKEPSIVDFGAGHSIQENPFYNYLLSNYLSKFKNVILLVPTQNKSLNVKILDSKLVDRGVSPEARQNNVHFIMDGYNERVATKTIYTMNKSPLEVAKECEELAYQKERGR